MRALLFVTLTTAALLGAAPLAQAQGPVPDTIRASSLTQAQEQELNHRLALLQTQLRALASETELREGAVRNIAVEIFGARPDLDFEIYAALIDSGARELRTYITEARTRADPDPASQSLRAQAIAAAEDGRLTEARALYDQLIAANRAARQRERDAEDLADAADMAAAGRLAHVAADFRDAARRFGEAAALAPQSTHEQWLYVMLEAEALRTRGERFEDVADLQEAVRGYRAALSRFPRATHPDEWAGSQTGLGLALVDLSARGDDAALRAAIQAFRAGLEVSTRDYAPRDWAGLQGNLGMALTELARRGDSTASQPAIQAYRAALEVYTRDLAPQDWAQTQMNLGVALAWQASQGDEAALQEAIEAFRGALDLLTRDNNPLVWATTSFDLAIAYSMQGHSSEARIIAQQALAVFEQIGHQHHADAVRRFLASEPK